MNTTIRIERALPSDRDEILTVTKTAYAEYAVHSNPEFWRNYELSIERTILNDESALRICAKEGTRIRGCVLYCPPYEKLMGRQIVKNPFPEMRLLAVPAASRNKGIAARLIEFCEAKAREEGWMTITLHTTVLMQTAKQMYERRGYVRYEEIDFEPVPGFVVWGYRKDF